MEYCHNVPGTDPSNHRTNRLIRCGSQKRILSRSKHPGLSCTLGVPNRRYQKHSFQSCRDEDSKNFSLTAGESVHNTFKPWNPLDDLHLNLHYRVHPGVPLSMIYLISQDTKMREMNHSVQGLGLRNEVLSRSYDRFPLHIVFQGVQCPTSAPDVIFGHRSNEHLRSWQWVSTYGHAHWCLWQYNHHRAGRGNALPVAGLARVRLDRIRRGFRSPWHRDVS